MPRTRAHKKNSRPRKRPAKGERGERGLTPKEKLEALKRRLFPAKGKEQRVARALAALHQPETLRLTPQQWKWIAEDPGLEDQFE